MRRVKISAFELKSKSVGEGGIKELIKKFSSVDPEYNKITSWESAIGKSGSIARRFSYYLDRQGIKNALYLCKGYKAKLDAAISAKFKSTFSQYKKSSDEDMQSFFTTTVVVVGNLAVDILAEQFVPVKYRIVPMITLRKLWDTVIKQDK